MCPALTGLEPHLVPCAPRTFFNPFFISEALASRRCSSTFCAMIAIGHCSSTCGTALSKPCRLALLTIHGSLAPVWRAQGFQRVAVLVSLGSNDGPLQMVCTSACSCTHAVHAFFQECWGVCSGEDKTALLVEVWQLRC